MTVSLRKGIRALIRTTSAADNPPAGHRALIPKTDGWYDRDEAGVETNLNLSGSGGGGGLTLTTVEIDCGTVAKDKIITTVTVAASTPTSKIIATQAGLAATGRQADENEMDQFLVVAVPLSGSVQFVLNSLHGTLLQGKVKIHYAIG